MELAGETARPLVIIENDPQVPPGLVAEVLGEHGISFRLVRVHAGEPLPERDDVAAVIVLGGVMGVGETETFPYLVPVKGFVRECAETDVPFLGICLGGQLLAEALGAAVTANCCGEKGICGVALAGEGMRDPLFRGIPGEFTSFQWHNDSFGLPQGAALLAVSPTCSQQAIRYGRRVYGLQFHPEVTPAIVAAWRGRGAVGSETGTDVLEDFYRAEEPFRAASRTLLANFLRIAGLIS